MTDSLWAFSLAWLSGRGIGIEGFSDVSGFVSKLCFTERAQVPRTSKAPTGCCGPVP